MAKIVVKKNWATQLWRAARILKLMK
jgi:hypothetical protein